MASEDTVAELRALIDDMEKKVHAWMTNNSTPGMSCETHLTPVAAQSEARGCEKSPGKQRRGEGS